MWNDDDIARRARRAISSDYYVPRDKVEIRIDQGWLTLIGDLNWLYEKHAAEADVRLLPGVFGVTNAIAIKQGSEASELRALGMARRAQPTPADIFGRRSNNSRWRAQAGPGILAVGVAAMSEELHTRSNTSVVDQTEMPLPFELSTVFFGGLFLLALLAAVYAVREIVLPVVLPFVLICSWRRPCAGLSG